MIAVKLLSPDPGRYRLGDGDLQSVDDCIHSDTLFNGLVCCYRNLYGLVRTNELIGLFSDVKIKLSSAFYFIDVYRNGQFYQCIYFFPKPYLSKLSQKSETDYDDITSKKQLKKLKFFSLSAQQKLLSSVTQQESDWYHDTDFKQFETISGEFALLPEELPAHILPMIRISKFRAEVDAPKVAIQRSSGSSADIYYQADIEMRSVEFSCIQQNGNWIYSADRTAENETTEKWTIKPGFFFLLDHQLPDTTENKLMATLRLLSEEGIGGERSSGAGFFRELEINSFKWQLRGRLNINLSLVSPDETDYPNIVNYQPILRGGYVGGTVYRKKRVRLIREGAIFSEPVLGKLVDVTPNFFPENYRLYQNGINLAFQFGE